MIAFSSLPLSELSRPLWLACFDDATEEELVRLLACFPRDTRVLLSEENGRAVSQGVLMPLTLCGRRGYYLYAIATHPAFRGRGYMRAFLAAAKAEATKNGLDFLLLIPATHALCDTYRRAGFLTELPLAADEAGEDPIYRLPQSVRLLPYDGDFDALFARYDGELSRDALCAALASVADRTEIFYTESGFCAVSCRDHAACFTADGATLSTCQIRPSPYRALLCPLTELFIADKVADPLPR